MTEDLYPDVVRHYLQLYWRRWNHERFEEAARRGNLVAMDNFEALSGDVVSTAFMRNATTRALIADAWQQGVRPSQAAANLIRDYARTVEWAAHELEREKLMTVPGYDPGSPEGDYGAR